MINLPGYHIIEQLYDSANSLVYRGHQHTDDRAVILKLLKDPSPSPERIAWFKREYEITRSIQTSGVPRIYALETKAQHWIMVQEDFGGESLRKLNVSGTCSINDFLHIAIAITDILGQIHQQHIMHKDINPANIVVNMSEQQVKLIDFGIATILSRENPTFRNPTMLEGTLAYMSPEQAGRMNRAIDYRTDFYSLGITFYELLTGELPFTSDDPLELVHSHIARQPRIPHEVREEIPETLSAIILKLMAKNAEDRYQSAYGIKADLEQCLQQWQTTGTIDIFVPGQYDVSDRFQIPQKLYGRDPEITILMAAFERVSQGASDMMLVSGSAGIGKSALVQELYKPITRQRGYFIAGKFDQFQRNIPYSAFIQAFRSLIRHLLTESEGSIACWRDRILTAAGNNGQVLLDVIPEMELIIGLQPELPKLGPAESQNRLSHVFQNFVHVFTRPEHPLVIFLDDLQWADGASLKLMELLMTAPDTHYLFLIGSYRENEVRAGHPLFLSIDTMRQAQATIHTLTLAPLDIPGVIQLITETLHCPPNDAQPLARLVVAKTGGNPFFLNEFLKSLYDEKLIWFDYEQGAWSWELSDIQSQDITDNVVDLMAGKMQRMNQEAQQVIKLASCIGNQFDLETLAIVLEKPAHDAAHQLWDAVAEGLIVPLSDAYKLAELVDADDLSDTLRSEYRFTHDRIQQAAYSLMGEQERQHTHWRIGHLLLQREQEWASKIDPQIASSTTTDIPCTYPYSHCLGEHTFDIVTHLNQGCRLLTKTLVDEDNPATKPDITSQELADLNLVAGTKALASSAYQPAMNYLTTGIQLLEAEDWERCYALSLALHREYAKCAYLNGHFAEAERVFQLAIEQATTNLDKAEIYNTEMVLYTSMGQLKGVIEIGLEALKLLGITIDFHPDETDIEKERQAVQVLLTGRSVADLANLPKATDPHHLASMRLLMNILITAWWRTNMQLLYMVTFQMVHRSLRFGNAEESSVGYLWYGAILGSGMHNYQTGEEFGKLALHLNELWHSVSLTSMVNIVYGVFIHFWRYHLSRSLPYLKTGYKVGIETGDVLWAGINSYAAIYTMLIKGDHLDDVYQEIQHYLDFAKSTHQIIPINMLTVSQQFILCMKGLTKGFASFSDHYYDEEQHIAQISTSEAFRPLFWYYKTKLQALYLFEYYEEAKVIADKLDHLIEEGAAFGNVTMPEHYLYYSLTMTARYPACTEEEQTIYWQILTRNRELMKMWAETCPENYRHKYLMIAAEMARLKGQDQAARFLYEQAIAAAHEHNYQQNEALSHELATRFYLACDQETIASNHLREARNGYLKWGSAAKVRALDERYPHILKEPGGVYQKPQQQHGFTETPSVSAITTSSGLDLSTVMKASQAISGEIVLDTLLSKLMHIVIENAGAEHGKLLLKRGEEWVIEAEGSVQQEVTVMQSLPLHDASISSLLPVSIINYVIHSQKSLVLHDASHEGQFTHDEYISTKHPLSILCTPLINRGTLLGVLFLENNLTTGAFTQDRLEVLNLLASQAAISIQNAVLYTNLEQSEEKYRNLFENSRDTIFITTLAGQVVNMNNAGIQLFSYTAEEMATFNTLDLYACANDRAVFQQTIATQGSVHDYPIKLRKKDGSLIDCLMSANIRYASDGTPSGYEGIIRDITEQKRAEAERAALLDQQARKAGELHAIIQSMADGLLVVDMEEHIVIVNPVAATLLEQEPHELTGQPIETICQVDDPVMATGLQQIVEQVRNELGNPNQKMPDGLVSLGKRIVRLQSAPTLASGILTGAVMVLQDITEEVEADRAKNAFIATASHEMRTPLASMKGFVDIFYMSGIENLNENQRLFLDAIKRQTENLVVMVNDLLEVARLDQAPSGAERRWVSPADAIEECITNLTTQIEQRRLFLTVEVSQGLPYIWIDALHMRRILTNLISNAVKYVHPGGDVYVRAFILDDPSLLPSSPVDQPWKAQEERSVVIEVEDNGVGIRTSDQPKIFTRFFRSENPLTVEAGGSGLGLAITKSLVHLHNGQIGFHSVEQEGSCFWVRFPAPFTEQLINE